MTIRFTPAAPVLTRWSPSSLWAVRHSSAVSASARWKVKSDDVIGRVKTYEAIVKGHNIPQSGVPESFKVLVKELQSLGLDIKVLDKAGEEIDLKQSFEDDEDVSFRSAEEDDRYDDPDAFSVQEDGDMDGYTTGDAEDMLDDNEPEFGMGDDLFGGNDDDDLDF